MADTKPTAKAASPATASGPVAVNDPKAPASARQGVGDPSGRITNRDDAGGTRQTEPKPEDYPAAAKVSPPATQINTSASQAVGEPAPIVTTSDDLNDALASAQEGIDAARAKTDERFADKARDEGLID